MIAVLACMDRRYDPLDALGLAVGEAFVLRNGGGFATPDALRGLALAVHRLAVDEVVVAHHSDCRALATDDVAFRAELAAATGAEPPWTAPAYADGPSATRATVEALRTSPFLPGIRVRGVVVDVETGKVEEVVALDEGVTAG